MRNLRLLTVILFTLFVQFSFATGQNYFIAPNGNDANDGMSLGQAKASLENMLMYYYLNETDTVFIMPGEYEFFTEISLSASHTKAVIIGVDGADSVVFRASSPGKLFDVSCPLYLQGITIKDAGTGSDGGAIQINTYNEEVEIVGCQFKNCKVSNGSDGGAIHVNSFGKLKIESCAFIENEAEGDGSAIYIKSGEEDSLLISNCLFVGNKTKEFGGSEGHATVFIKDDGAGTATSGYASIQHCTFSKNTVEGNDGAVVERNVSTHMTYVVNSIFVDDSATYDIGGLHAGIFVSNTYAENVKLVGMVSNAITEEPEFLDAASNDFRLTGSSSGVDEGSSTNTHGVMNDITGYKRDGRPDLGAYEYYCDSFTISFTEKSGATCVGVNDAAVRVDLSGGASRFNYSWGSFYGGRDIDYNIERTLLKDSVENIKGGWVFLKVEDDDNCIVYDSIELSQPDSIVFTVPGYQKIAEGNSVTLTATTVEPGVTFNWSPFVTNGTSFTPATSQDYIVTATKSGGCQKDTVRVVIPDINYYVSPSGNDANDGKSPATAKATLEDVLKDYNLGLLDTIFVAEGVYNEDFVKLDTLDDGFVIMGAGPDKTIFDGAGSVKFLEIPFEENDSITIQNLTIRNYGSETTNGSGSAVYIGGGTVHKANKGLRIKNVVFDNNDAQNNSSSYGGAIAFSNYARYSDLIIDSCIFKNNNGGAAGCISNHAATGNAVYIDVKNTVFHSNGSNHRSAIYRSANQSMAVLNFENSVFYNNESDRSAILFWDGEATFSNCLFYENSAVGSFPKGVFEPLNAQLNLIHCTVVDNKGGGVFIDYSETETNVYSSLFQGNSGKEDFDKVSGQLNVYHSIYQTTSSAFDIDVNNNTNPVSFVDSLNDLYRLRPATNGVDDGYISMGTSKDITGMSRDGNPDIGAYESNCVAMTVDLTVKDSIFCFGQTGIVEVSITGGTMPYEVDFGYAPGTAEFGDMSEITSSLVASNPEIAGKKFVTVRDAFQCQEVDSVVLTQPSDSIGVRAMEDTSICAGQSIVLSASGTEDTLYWSDGLDTGAIMTPEISVMYYVEVVQDSNCKAKDSVQITVNPKPNALLMNDAMANKVCKDSVVNFTATGGDAYQFFVNGILVADTLDGAFSSDALRNEDQIVVGVKASNGCIDYSDTTIIQVEPCVSECPMMVSNFTYQLNGFNITVKDSSTGPATNWAWSVNGIHRAFGDSITATFLRAGYHNVCLTVYDSVSKCTDQHCKIIQVADTATLDSNAVAPVFCKAVFGTMVVADTVRFVNASLGTFDKYRWHFGDGRIGDSRDTTIVYAEPGFYEVCLSVLDSASGCTDQICKTVEVEAPEDTIIPVCHADFKFFIDIENKSISLTNKCEGDVSDFFWSFGDGTFSKDLNPSKIFEEYDFYNVRLTTYDSVSGCQATIVKKIGVHDTAAVTCQASFTYFIDDSNYVHFNNTSSGAHSKYYWMFGDGGLSQVENPVHKYRGGFYQVRLNTYDSASQCISSVIQEIEIIDPDKAYCKAKFSAFPNEDGSVSFTNESSGNLTYYYYNFGDNSRSKSADTSHVYALRGYYTVCLTVVDTAGGCLDQYCMELLAGPEEQDEDTIDVNCQSKFDYYPDGLKVNFTNQSLGDYKQVYWTYGDGNSSRNDSDTSSYTFAEGGYYSVTLTVVDTNTTCFNSYTEVVAVIDTATKLSESCLADFNYMPEDSGLVKFKNEAKGRGLKYYWDFGDGSQPVLGKNPAHRYRKFGYYEVCLTVFNVSGCQESHCEVIGLGDLSDACWADFDFFVDDAGLAKFKNASLGNPLSYTWDFGDTVTSEQKDPGHSYAENGYYGVCLTVTHDSSGCESIKCKDVNIGSALANSCLFTCVWPGDANDDLEANHYDVLAIGLNFGQEGPKRDSVSNKWLSQSSTDWTTWQKGGVNNRHADCNGDGVINSKDTNAIKENFAYSHYRQYKLDAEGDVELSLNVEGNIVPGGVITIDVIAGDDITPLTMYGVGWELGFEAGAIDYSTATVDWSDTWLDDDTDQELVINDWTGDDDVESDDLVVNDWTGDDDVESDDLIINDWTGDDDVESDDLWSDDWIGDDEEDADLWSDDWVDDNDEDDPDLWSDDWMEDEDDTLMMTFDYLDVDKNLLMISGTRLDNRNVIGEGVLASITVIIDSSFTGDSLNINVFSQGAIEASGSEIEFENESIAVSVDRNRENFIVDDLKLFPNPTEGNVQFYLGLNDQHTIQVFDVTGRLVMLEESVNGGLITLDLEKLNAGMYTVDVRGLHTIYRGKLKIVH